MATKGNRAQRAQLASYSLSLLLIGLGWVIGLIAVAQFTTQGSIYYVNASSGDDNNDGTSPATAWRTIAKANALVQPGDTVLIYSGRYGEAIAPRRSGTAQMRIAYRAAPGETVIIEGAERLLDLRQKSYITVEGMTFRDPIYNWGEIQNGHYNEIIGNTFIGNGRGPRTAFVGLLLSDGSSYNRILNNVFQDWGDLLTQWGDALGLDWSADHTLIEGNRFLNAGHALLDIDTSFNIVRNNYFDNAWQKGIDVVWRVSPPWAPGQEFVARRNVIEHNFIVRANRLPSGQQGTAGVQLAAAETIFRRNVLIENETNGIILNGWGDAPKVYGNRIYHNTVVANGTPGLFATNWGIRAVNISDNVLKNNIFYQNDWKESGVQVQFDFLPEAAYGAGFFQSYMIAGNCISRAPTIDIQSLDGVQSLMYYQRRYPQFMEANLDAEPQFVNPAADDYRLASGSPCIDAGVPLTTTESEGSGRIVPVADASYFTDGYGLAPGDQVKIGSNPAVPVLRVDYTNNTLTLARSVHWTEGDPVYLGDFRGRGPDVGALEFGDPEPSPPQPVESPSLRWYPAETPIKLGRNRANTRPTHVTVCHTNGLLMCDPLGFYNKRDMLEASHAQQDMIYNPSPPSEWVAGRWLLVAGVRGCGSWIVDRGSHDESRITNHKSRMWRVLHTARPDRKSIPIQRRVS